MEKLHIAVCDDDMTARDMIAGSLKGIFAQHGVEADLEVYGSADALGADMSGKVFDLLLLDIDMPGTDGITFADHLRAEHNNIEIIYISNREDRVFDSLRSMPCGFIRKSRFLQDTSEIVDLYLKNRATRSRHPKLVLHTQDGMESFQMDQVIYVEGVGKYQDIVVKGRAEPAQVRRSMQELENELSEYGFLRVHKGYLVNYRYIRRIDEAGLLLTTGQSIPVARRKLGEIKERYLTLMQSENNMLF